MGAINIDINSEHRATAKVGLEDLKGKTVRGGFIAIISQAAKFILRTGSVMVLARMLMPEEFGLVGMVTAVTGILGLFRDAGLSMATVQRDSITDEQVSTLFWINVAVGALLCGLSIAVAPLLVYFYQESRLFWITVAMGFGFFFTAAGAQHYALLQRHMRYAAIASVEILSLIVSIVVGITMAYFGLKYWALVGMAVSFSFAGTAGAWLFAAWVPGVPRRNVGIRSMLHFGSTLTLNAVVVYLAYNADKVLLGRYWGAGALGIYGRAYQLINMPTEQMNSALGWVAFPALSRLQDDPDRFRSYFLKGYSLVLTINIPITIACALFAEDMIYVLLGPKWADASVIFRLLAPTVLALGLINPFGWLLIPRGQVGRSFKMALVIAPSVIAAYIVGLRYGPVGVACGYSIMMILLIVPMIAWAKHGSPISSRDIIRVVNPPFISGIIAAALTFGIRFLIGESVSPIMRLLLGCGILFGVYIVILLYVMRQKEIYIDVLRGFKMNSSEG